MESKMMVSEGKKETEEQSERRISNSHEWAFFHLFFGISMVTLIFFCFLIFSAEWEERERERKLISLTSTFEDFLSKRITFPSC